MGSLIGKAVTLSGDEVQVTLDMSGEFPVGEVLRIADIHLQMDGGEGYVPSKMTTASVTCLTDGIGLLNAMHNETVSVEVVNVTQGRVLFCGYVVPNTLSQGVTGINDLVTIECVDSIGYAQYVHYRRMEDDDLFTDMGFQVMTLQAVIERIAGMVGARRIAAPDSIIISNPVSGDTTTEWQKLTISEEYMYSSDLPSPYITDATSRLSYMPNAMTCREALDMIAESFRMTWMQVGDTLYLFDDVGTPQYRDLTTGEVIAAGEVLAIKENDVRDAACNVSTRTGYSSVTLHHDVTEERMLMPDIFDLDYLSVGNPLEEDVYDGENDNTKILATTLRSEIYVNYLGVGNINTNTNFVAWKEVQGWTYLGVFSYDKNTTFKDGTWTIALKLFDQSDEPGMKKLLQIRPHFPLSVVKTGNAYICFDIDFIVSNKSQPEVGYLYPKNEEHQACYLWASLKIGNKYYNIKTNAYEEEEKKFLIEFDANGNHTLNLDNASVGYRRTKIPVLAEGEVEVTIYSRNGNNLGWNIGFLKKINVMLKRGWTQEKALPATEVYGEFTPGKELDVTPPIDLHYTLAPKRFGTVVDGVEYRANGEVKLRFAMNAATQITLPRRIYEQANGGDGLKYELSIDDRGNGVTALDSATCDMWNGKKRIAGYMQEVLDNKITLTLI